MSREPMTPQDDQFEPGSASYWSNHSIAYKRDFEDAVMQIVLKPPELDGIVLLNNGENAPNNPSAVSRSDIDCSTLPKVTLEDLPLPLDHPSRVFRCTVPGIRLTHPGGLLEGGLGPGSSEATAENERIEFVQTLIEENHVRKASNFWQVVEKEKQDAMRELADRMRARDKATRQNEDIEQQLIQLREQRDLEVRVWERRMGMGKG